MIQKHIILRCDSLVRQFEQSATVRAKIYKIIYMILLITIFNEFFY